MRLAKIQDAVPFQSGLKWGLRAGSRVIVPPIYRSIQNPVGNYCVVETNPRQWGIIRLDGKVGGRGTVHECGDKQWRDSPVDRLPWHNKDGEFKIALKFI